VSVLAQVVFDRARSLLNDQSDNLWTNDVLLNKLQQAHAELQIKLRRAGADVMLGQYTESVAANATTFASQPADLVMPIQLWEKVHSSAITTYALMTEVNPLPNNLLQGTTLQRWTWYQEAVTFIGATAIVDVFMTYQREIATITSGSDPIGFIDGELYLAPRLAALAYATTASSDIAAQCDALAQNSLAEVLYANRGRAPGIEGTTERP